MSIFDQIGKRLSDAGQGAAQQAKTLAEITRLNGVVFDLEKKLSNMYESLGRAYFANNAQEALPQYTEQIQSIQVTLAQVAECKEKIKQLKGVTKCTYCGADIPNGAHFCSACGKQSALLAMKKCTKCGELLDADSVFCISCGTRVEVAAPQQSETEATE